MAHHSFCPWLYVFGGQKELTLLELKQLQWSRNENEIGGGKCV